MVGVKSPFHSMTQRSKRLFSTSGKRNNESGSFDLYPPALQESDRFLNPLQSPGIKQLRVCGRLLAHLVQKYQHVLRFIAWAIHHPLLGHI